MVDIHFPALDVAYDFSLAEDVQISVLIEEVAEMICQREKLTMPKNLEAYALCCASSGRILPRESILMDCGVSTGNRLILL